MKRDWTAYDSAKQSMYVRDEYRCRHCRSANMTPHHLVWRSAGGHDTLDNLLTLCMRCHDAVHDGLLEVQWGPLGGDGPVTFIRKAGYR